MISWRSVYRMTPEEHCTSRHISQNATDISGHRFLILCSILIEQSSVIGLFRLRTSLSSLKGPPTTRKLLFPPAHYPKRTMSEIRNEKLRSTAREGYFFDIF